MRAAVWTGFMLCFLAATAVAGKKQPGWVEVDRVIAVVNQDVVLASELTRRTAGLSAGQKPLPQGAKKQVLDGMIDEILFAQEASRMRITVSDQEVEAAIQEIKQVNKLDDAGLLKALADQGYTLELYREDVRRQILHIRALNLVIRPRIQVDEEELAAAYKGAKKANPKLGTFEAEKERLRQAMYEQRMAGEARNWLAEQRLTSFIAVRAP